MKKVFIFVIFPLIFSIFLASIYSERVILNRPIAFIDNDNSTISRQLTRMFKASRAFNIIYDNDKDKALEKFENQQVDAVISIPANFQQKLKRQESTEVNILINSSNIVIANTLNTEMKTIITYFNYMIRTSAFLKMGLSKYNTSNKIIPIKTDFTKFSNPNLNYQQYLAPGVILAIFHQLLLLFGSMNKNKTTVKGLALSAYYFILFSIILFAFKITFNGSFTKLFLQISLLGLSATSLGMFIRSFSKNDFDTIRNVIMITSPAFVLSGFTYPLDAVPGFIVIISKIIPLTSALEGFKSLQSGNIFLIYNNLILIVEAIVFLTLAYFMGRNKDVKENIAR